MACEVHQISAVLPVVNCEGRIKADLGGIVPQEPRTDAVEGPGPNQRARYPHRAVDVSPNPFHSSDHFAGGPPRKGDEKDASRIGTIHNEMGDPISQRVGFS